MNERLEKEILLCRAPMCLNDRRTTSRCQYLLQSKLHLMVKFHSSVLTKNLTLLELKNSFQQCFSLFLGHKGSCIALLLAMGHKNSFEVFKIIFRHLISTNQKDSMINNKLMTCR